jgi:hypothetical protein
MIEMGFSDTALGALRRRRLDGALLFVLLLLLVAGERRLAEAHFNLRSSQPTLEHAEALDGDEIRIRLIVLNDDQRPSVADVGRALASAVVPVHTPLPTLISPGRPAPRGPPSRATSAA